MVLIELTQVLGGNKYPVFVMASNIVQMERVDEEVEFEQKFTTVSLTNQLQVYVNETPQEIAEKIAKQARALLRELAQGLVNCTLSMPAPVSKIEQAMSKGIDTQEEGEPT